MKYILQVTRTEAYLERYEVEAKSEEEAVTLICDDPNDYLRSSDFEHSEIESIVKINGRLIDPTESDCLLMREE